MFKTKDELLNKLRSYATSQDDDNIRYKEKIKNSLLKCPELLYALHELELEDELFTKTENGDIVLNISEDGELLGEVDRYFGKDSNIRPYLFVPETQTNIKHYICYQVGFDDIPRYEVTQKYNEVVFNIFVNGKDSIDECTGIPRHDLIASIIREKVNWSNIFGRHAKLISSKESTTDNDFLVRTLVFQIVDTNSIVETIDGKTGVYNYKVRW